MFIVSLQAKLEKDSVVEQDDSDVDSDVEEDAKDSDYDYLLGMAMWCLTAEKKEELLKKKDDKHKELEEVLNWKKNILINWNTVGARIPNMFGIRMVEHVR